MNPDELSALAAEDYRAVIQMRLELTLQIHRLREQLTSSEKDVIASLNRYEDALAECDRGQS